MQTVEQIIDAVGTAFDPTQHQAMAQIDSDEHPANHVAAQHQVGYQLYDRLLRPALVSVSRGNTGNSVATSPDSD